MSLSKSKTAERKEIPFNNLLPAFGIDAADIGVSITRVLASGWYILGNEVAAFETEFAKLMGMNYSVGCASGTDALTMALMSVYIEPKDTVLTVANSAPPTVVAIKRTGAKVRFVDVDENGLMDVDKIKSSDLDGVKAVVPVHLYGRMCNINKLYEICQPKGVYIIEDACQAHGSGGYKYKIGDRSIAAAYSFYPTKNLGCLGDGGAVVTKHKEIADRIKQTRNYGLAGPNLTHYGMNSRLDELQAAILRARMMSLTEINRFKREITGIYFSLLSDIEYIKIRDHWAGDNHHLMPIFAEDRDQLKTFLLQNGIKTQIHYEIPAHRQAPEGYHPPLPMTEELCKRELSLPNWYGIDVKDVELVALKIRRFYGK